MALAKARGQKRPFRTLAVLAVVVFAFFSLRDSYIVSDYLRGHASSVREVEVSGFEKSDAPQTAKSSKAPQQSLPPPPPAWGGQEMERSRPRIGYEQRREAYSQRDRSVGLTPDTTKTDTERLPEDKRPRTSRKAVDQLLYRQSNSNLDDLSEEEEAEGQNRTFVRKTVCENTCSRARDGVCQEGRSWLAAPPGTAPAEVWCDFGTDCADCGAWEFEGAAEALDWRPVQDILGREAALRLALTSYPTRFVFGHTDPELDVDVSNQVANQGVFEPHVSKLWHALLNGTCVDRRASVEATAPESARRQALETQEPLRRRLVLDVGGNFGYYAVLAASEGCRVITWEPVPLFGGFLRFNLLANNATALVELRTRAVGAQQDATVELVVPNRGIWGTAGVGGDNIDPNIPNDGPYRRIRRRQERLDSVVVEEGAQADGFASGAREEASIEARELSLRRESLRQTSLAPGERVLMLKADVEGYEPEVFMGAAKLLAKGLVDNAVFEYSPGVAFRGRNFKRVVEGSVFLASLLNSAYSMVDFTPLPPGEWGELPPRMRAVEATSLGWDVAEMERWVPPREPCAGWERKGEVRSHAGMWGCGQVPEGLHPHSFLSALGHNTNIWMARQWPQGWSPRGNATTLEPAVDFKSHYFTSNGVGQGGRPCQYLTPEVEIIHRCPCTNQTICGAHEKALRQAERDGDAPPYFFEPKVITSSVMDWLPGRKRPLDAAAGRVVQ
ncbi:hypothetical protein H632_c295p0 [Helicosporidium sp. ATCC 50920]|nr:hypothetical protein H632_c295p0 [Helicosporidium sp. ATCC 50920]|eukprot:KDD76257.1 hypothetical protein H632_c295p0 [Helicosporidium sp. ATCC 50920]